jgi:heat-inducible transcriptional repressor
LKHDSRDLSDRKKLILKAVVDAHIAYGEPVGSKYLTQNKDINCSSATIRNEMAELENMGYLMQPHTSAGRIPSEAGYRFYVDSLLQSFKTTKEEIDRLKQSLDVKQRQLDSILNSAIKMATNFSNYTSFAVKPSTVGGTKVKRYDFVYIDDYNSVIVMVMPSGSVKTRNVVTQHPVPKEALEKLSDVLNEKLSDRDATKVTLQDIVEMELEMGEYDFLVSPVTKVIYEELSVESGDLKVEGLSKLLSYPDYYDKNRLSKMLEMFETKNDFLEAVTRATSQDLDSESDNIKIYIGSENIVKVMDNSTLIFKPVKSSGRTLGAVGIVGPTRMNYRKVISMIDMLSRGVTELIGAPPPKGSEQSDGPGKEGNEK